MLLATSWVASESQAASFSATLEPDTVAVGDTATLKLTFEGSGQVQLSQMPNIPGLVISGPQQGTSIRVVNGQRAKTMSVSYYLRPTRTNVFVIPPFAARIGGQDFTSQPLRLRAVQATAGGSAQSVALLRLVVPREQLYLGQTMVMELQLILRGNATKPSEFDLPTFSGPGWLSGEPVQAQTRQAEYGGQVVTVYPIRIPVTPLQTGTLTLGPVTSSVVVQIPSRRRDVDPFRMFAFDLFERTEPRRVPLSLPTHSITVLPLPTENVPKTFSGAVGQFEMNVFAGPTNVVVGDPVTLRVAISGTGNMKSITLPDPLVEGDFKTYPPDIKLDTSDEFGLVGTKTVEQIVVPEHTEVRELPPIQFSFFDPTSGGYRTLVQPATPLLVMPAGTRPGPLLPPNGSSLAASEPRRDIVHIKQRLDDASTQPARSLGLRFYAFNAAPLVAWLGVLVWRKRTDALGRNPRLRRRHKVRRIVAQGLSDLRQLSRAGDSDSFFATVFRLLQEQLGLLLDLSASGITESVIDEKLGSFGVSEPTQEKLHELFQACNVARYAPTHDRQELAAMIPKVEQVFGELEALMR